MLGVHHRYKKLCESRKRCRDSRVGRPLLRVTRCDEPNPKNSIKARGIEDQHPIPGSDACGHVQAILTVPFPSQAQNMCASKDSYFAGTNHLLFSHGTQRLIRIQPRVHAMLRVFRQPGNTHAGSHEVDRTSRNCSSTRSRTSTNHRPHQVSPRHHLQSHPR